jgi:pilus assembly protein CpaB
MKVRGLVLIGVSALLGLAAVTWVKKPTATGMTSVVVAKVALNFGDQLTPAKLSLVDMPPASVPQGAFSAIDDVAKDNRVVLRAMVPGEPILTSKISGNGGRAILSTLIDYSMRAAAIRVNDVNGVAGFVQPGDRVDVMLTQNVTDRAKADTTLLLQNVKVLGIDQQADDTKDKAVVVKAVTLEVSPDDAQKLTLAGTIGSLSLSLRNYANPDAVAGRRLSVDDLVPTPPKDAVPVIVPAVVKTAAPPPTVEIFRGTQSTTYDVTRGSGSPPAEKTTPKQSKNAAVRRASAQIAHSEVE